MSHMRAIVCERYGPPEVLQKQEAPKVFERAVAALRAGECWCPLVIES